MIIYIIKPPYQISRLLYMAYRIILFIRIDDIGDRSRVKRFEAWASSLIHTQIRNHKALFLYHQFGWLGLMSTTYVFSGSYIKIYNMYMGVCAIRLNAPTSTEHRQQQLHLHRHSGSCHLRCLIRAAVILRILTFTGGG